MAAKALWLLLVFQECDPDYHSAFRLCCGAGCGFVAAMETTHQHP